MEYKVEVEGGEGKHCRSTRLNEEQAEKRGNK